MEDPLIQKQRQNLATQQQPRNKHKGFEMGGENGQANLQSSNMLRRNISEFAQPQMTAYEKRKRFAVQFDNDKSGERSSAILPKSGIHKASFIGSPIETLRSNDLENASTAYGTNMMKTNPISPSNNFMDRRHLRTRGGMPSGSLDFMSPTTGTLSSRGIFSSLSKGKFSQNQSNMNSDLHYNHPSNGQFPLSHRGSVQLKPQPQPNDDPLAIWNRHTFSFAVRPQMIRLSSKKAGSAQSDYLNRMQKSKIEKVSSYRERDCINENVFDVQLSRWADEEKNRVKAKREMLESLKTELEMIRLLSGNEQAVDSSNDEIKTENEGLSKSPSARATSNIMNKLALEMLRPGLENKAQLNDFAKSMTINNTLTHLGSPVAQSTQLSPTDNLMRTPATITGVPNLSSSVYQPYFLMTLDDDTIAANLLQMKKDLESKLKEVEFDHKSEFFVYQKLDAQRIREKKELTSLTLRHRDMEPEQLKFDKALEDAPRIHMLGSTAREQARNLLRERRKQLDRKRDFYHEVLQKKVKELRIESKDLDELKGAIGKRQKRVDEMKEHLQELKHNNIEDEQRKQELIQSMLNKNLEFKVLSGIEIIVKLEQALKSVDQIKQEKQMIDEQQGMETIKSVKKSAINVDLLSKEDLEAMNKQKIERLRIYEQHFAEVFPDIKKININDEYLQKRYEEICFSIQSLSSKYQELVQNSSYKKRLIKQYTKFQQQVEVDRQFLQQYNYQPQIDQESQIGKTTTLNDMRCAEFQLRRGLIQQDMEEKNKIIAQTCTFVNSTLGRFSYILREIFSMLRLEQTLPGKERLGPEQVPLTEYLRNNFLQLIQNYASKFSLENMKPLQLMGSSPDKMRSTQKQQIERKSGSIEASPQKKRQLRVESPNGITTVQRQNTFNHTIGQEKGFNKFPYNKIKSLVSLKIGNTLNDLKKRSSIQTQNLFGLMKTGTVRYHSPTRRGDDNSLNDQDNDSISQSFDISILDDLRLFLTVVIVKKEHLNLINCLNNGPVPREFTHSFSKLYISQHKILSKLSEVCQMTKLLGVNTAIYVNGMEFKQKYPQLGLDQDENKKSQQSSKQITNAGELFEDDSSVIVPEEDYVNPHSKHIVYDLLVSDKRRKDAEERRKKRDSEREKTLALMTESQRRDQNLKRLQKQVRAVKIYEKDEHSFREQFKSNVFDVFNKDLPKNRDNPKHTVLEGQALTQMTQTAIKHQKDPYKNFAIKIPTEFVGMTTDAALERQDHESIHRRLFTSPNQMLRTIELKTRQKKINQIIRTQQSTVNQDDEFGATSTLGGFFASQESTGVKSQQLNGENGGGYTMSKAQQREMYTQRLIERQLQRRTMVKIDKPEKKQPNMVLQLLQDKFPELERLFMDTAERRAHQRNLRMQVKSNASLLSEGNNNNGKIYNTAQSPDGDETTQLGGGGGYNSADDGTNHGQQIGGGYGTQQTIDDEDQSVGGLSEPVIKVKPVYPRGVFK